MFKVGACIKLRHLGFERLNTGLLVELHVGEEVHVPPGIKHVIRPGRLDSRHGNEHVENHMRIRGHIFKHAGYGVKGRIAIDGLAHRIFVLEIFPRSRLRKNDGLRRDEGRLGIAPQEIEAEHIEYISINVEVLLFLERFVSTRKQNLVVARKTNLFLDFREFGGKSRTDARTSPGLEFTQGLCSNILRVIRRYPVDFVSILVEAVIAQFIRHIHENEHEARDSHGQPDDVDG